MTGRPQWVKDRKEAFRIGFDRSWKIVFRGAHVTSDAGLLAFRELDEALGLSELAAEFLTDTRTGRNPRHGLVAHPAINLQPLGGLQGHQ